MPVVFGRRSEQRYRGVLGSSLTVCLFHSRLGVLKWLVAL